MEPKPATMGVLSLSHRITREVHPSCSLTEAPQNLTGRTDFAELFRSSGVDGGGGWGSGLSPEQDFNFIFDGETFLLYL